MIVKHKNIINKKAVEAPNMTLDSILKDIERHTNTFELNKDFQTITYVTKDMYDEKVYEYVQPVFRVAEESESSQPKFIIFSAPGATGKTALARHICYMKNGIYWDLPDNKVAEFSLQGALMRSVGPSNMSAFLESLENGQNFLVIDAFDEAEAGSGRTGIGFFLRDLNAITENCKHTCAILLARTESALFMKSYFEETGIPYAHYEVGLFTEENAKRYIKNKLKVLDVPITNVTEECINSQFSEIRRILSNKEETKAFIGYAPVLDALAMAYDEDRNTLRLLQETENGKNNLMLLHMILDKLLIREHDKFIKALQVKISEISNMDDITQSLYLPEEQLHRLFYMILFNEKSLTDWIAEKFPTEYVEEYLDVVGTQLPQHPFIRMRNTLLEGSYEFTGVAFRDYVIAYMLADFENSEFVFDYLADNPKYCPSQMLIEFYGLFAKNRVSGKYISLMYDSFRSKAQLGDTIRMNINGDSDDCSAEFDLVRDGAIVSSVELDIIDLKKGIYVSQLSNCYFDVDGPVYVGNQRDEARITNSVINCTKLVWCTDTVSIEAYSPGVCVIDSKEITNASTDLPHFEIKTDDRANFKVASCDSLKMYYRLLAYKSDDALDEHSNDFISFSNFIRRVLTCMRSHSKDTPARKMDFIDNRIVSSNNTKKNIMEFLLDKHILYTDEQDWLYKLDTDKMSEFNVKFHEVRGGEFDSLRALFDEYEYAV